MGPPGSQSDCRDTAGPSSDLDPGLGVRTRCNFGGTAATYTATRHAETVVGRRIDEHVEWTEKLLSRVAEAHAEFEEELARTAMSADHDQAEEVFATYNAAITGLRQEAPALPYGEVKEPLRAERAAGSHVPRG